MNHRGELIAGAEALVRAAHELKALHERTPLPESPELHGRGVRLQERLRSMLEGAERTARQIHRYCNLVGRSEAATAQAMTARVLPAARQEQEIGRCTDCMEPLAVGCSLCQRCARERHYAAAQGDRA